MKNSGLFPFNELKMFLEVDIDNYLKKFYKVYESEESSHRIKSINKETFQFEIYKDVYKNDESESKIIDFQQQIKYILIEQIDKSIYCITNKIEDLTTHGTPIENYLVSIHVQLRELEENLIHSKFKFIPNYFESIKKVLDQYSLSPKIESGDETYNISPFKVLDNFRRPFFTSLFYLIIDNNLIKSGNLNKEGFISVLTDDNTNEILQFECESSIMICFLEGIKPVFETFIPRIIEESKRFKTKQGHLLTKTNYDSAKNRTEFDNPKLIELQYAIGQLISVHSS